MISRNRFLKLAFGGALWAFVPAAGARPADRGGTAGADGGFLPLFPLEIVVFPGQLLPLHIFEPRYKQLFRECQDDGITFGMPPYAEGHIAEYGTEMALEQVFKTYDNGELDAVARGVGVFRLIELRERVPGKLYSGALIERVENDPSVDATTQAELLSVFNEFHRRANTGQSIDGNPPENLSFAIGHRAGLNFRQAAHLLALSAETDRQRFLLDHLKRALRAMERKDAAPPA